MDNAPKTKWTRKVLEGWNEVELTEATGRFVIRSVMMAAVRNGCWKKEWVMWDTTRHPLTGRATYRDMGGMRELQAMAADLLAVPRS